MSNTRVFIHSKKWESAVLDALVNI